MELGHVLAAAYEPIRDVLDVLDEVEEHRGWRTLRRVRLVRVGLADELADDAVLTLPLQIVGEWPRLGLTTRFALAPAVDGTLWLVASGRASHTVLRVDASSAAIVRGTFVGAGALAQRPVAVDERGISYITYDLRGRGTARGVRMSDLRSVRPVEVASCF